MQNLVVVSHTVCVHVGVTKKFGGRWGPPLPWARDVSDHLETRSYPTYVITPNFVAVGQTVRASGGPKNLGRWGPLGTEAWLTAYKHALIPRVLLYQISSIWIQSIGCR